MTPPGAVLGNPDLEWISIDDMIWLSWMMLDAPEPLAARSDEAQTLLRGNLLEAHHPRNDIGKPHGVGWIDVTSGTKHKVVQLEPLTITASVLCAQGCGFHGFITDGHWISA